MFTLIWPMKHLVVLILNRESFWTLTVKADTKLLLDFVAIFEEEIIPVKRVAAFRPVIIFEPMSTTITSKFLKHGGNAVGVTPADGPLMGMSRGSSRAFHIPSVK